MEKSKEKKGSCVRMYVYVYVYALHERRETAQEEVCTFKNILRSVGRKVGLAEGSVGDGLLAALAFMYMYYSCVVNAIDFLFFPPLLSVLLSS